MTEALNNEELGQMVDAAGSGNVGDLQSKMKEIAKSAGMD